MAYDPFDRFLDPFYDPTLDLSLPFVFVNDLTTPTDRFDQWGNRDRLGNHRIPRHAESRVMTEREGDVVWRPATDVFETSEFFFIHIDLPGVPKDDISIDLRDRELIVQGDSKGFTYECATSRVRERNIGRFRKHVYLPRDISITKDDVEASYRDGLLEIKIPRGKSEEMGQITIK
ncbi:HSP20-like chaperone [Gigaspora margarita]|uniref:HSP20-like chaperone n=1 Tax=Gigaspora margarita TaxID=4874 RepID=A0A8H4A5L8_GIGMA|nr:HSP20-like chaperone [Gigaspora margarita]